jgi:hypothetical protein
MQNYTIYPASMLALGMQGNKIIPSLMELSMVN